jgi:predicted site-specific integrase-resolvase
MKDYIENAPDVALVSRRTAGQLLGVCAKTLYRWERAKRITGIKLNARTTRYYKHELEKLIADSVVVSGGAE